LKTIKEDINKAEAKQIKESIEEIAADKEEVDKEAQNEKRESKLFMNMSPEEEKLIEDVLREFFA